MLSHSNFPDEFNRFYELNYLLVSNGKYNIASATDRTTRQRFILKWSNLNVDSLESNFLKEKNITSRLNLDGIPKCHDLIYIDKKPLLLYHEYEGITLRQYLPGDGDSITHFLTIAENLIITLEKLHNAGISYNNLNPDTIIIHPDTLKIILIDFCLSSNQEKFQSNFMDFLAWQNSLQYISPESSGRINTSVDYRTDMYSLGLCFYFILTGAEPFSSTLINEIIYSHLAVNPDSSRLTIRQIPEIIILIINTLTSKNPDDRYQNLSDLHKDILECKTQYLKNGTLHSFDLSLNKKRNKISLENLHYGRKEEINILRKALTEAKSGTTPLVLIEGETGIGKTSLVNEFRKKYPDKNAVFIQGRFDAYKTNIPCYAFRESFHNLIQIYASFGEEKIKNLKNSILESLGPNLPIIAELIPEINTLINVSNKSAELNIIASENRLLLAIKEFAKVFCTSVSPMILFLDNLQWSDESSLKLLNEINNKIPFLLIILAYRTPDKKHQSNIQQQIEIWKSTNKINLIRLNPLKEAEIQHLLSDTFHFAFSDLKKLATIINNKTNGNPFYLNELLKTSLKDKTIEYSNYDESWKFDKQRLEKIEFSSNVLELINDWIEDLPKPTITVLTFASCLGMQFDLTLLCKYFNQTASQIMAQLIFAVQHDIIMPLDDKYQLIADGYDFNSSFRFQHTRIREAIYSLSSKIEKSEYHYFIGNYLLEQSSLDETEEHIIDLANHFNQCISKITSLNEKLKIAEINLKAGLRSQSSISYNTALEYFQKGIELLGPNPWPENYSMCYQLYFGLAQNAYQAGHTEMAEKAIDQLMLNVNSKLDKVKTLSMRLRQYTTLGRTEEAISKGVEGLSLLGIKIKPNPGTFEVLKEVLIAKWKLRKYKTDELLSLPEMVDEEKKLAARILTEIGPAAYILGNDNLYALTSLKVVNLSVEYGNCGESSFAYTTYGAVLAEAFNDFINAEKYAQLALDINSKLNNIEYRCRVIAAYGVLMHHFSRPWTELSSWFKKGIDAGFASGDLFFLGYCAVNHSVFDPSVNLKKSLDSQLKDLEITRDTHFQDAIDTAILNLQLTKALVGQTLSPFSLSDNQFDELQLFKRIKDRKYNSGLGFYYIYKAYLFYLIDSFEKANEYIQLANQYRKSMTRLIQLTFLDITAYFNSIKLLQSKKKNSEYKKLIKFHKKGIIARAQFNPTNFKHIEILRQAVDHSINDEFLLANSLFDQCITMADQNEFFAIEAMACEWASDHYKKNNCFSSAYYFLRKSYALYLKMDYIPKAQQLLVKLSEIENIDSSILSTQVNQDESIGINLELESIINASQTLSSEIKIESLLDKMIEIIMVNSGSEKVVLLIDDQGILIPQAFALDGRIQPISDFQYSSNDLVPQSVAQYVYHLKESLVLNDASRNGNFVDDPYILQNKTHAILCIPILALGKLFGIIYLENNKLTGAFTEDRIRVINMLASQMAISIQNAKLYSQLEDKVNQRTQELTQSYNKLKETQSQLIQSEKMASLGELTAGIAHEIQNPLNFINNFAELNTELIQELNINSDSIINEESKEILKNVKENSEKIVFHGKRAESIVKGMLQHSRKTSDQKSSTDLNLLIEEYVRLSFHGMRAKNKSFNTKINTILDPQLPKVDVFGQEIGRVLLNLLNNAYYAVDQKSNLKIPNYNPLVEVSTKVLEGKVQIQIRDNGIGIPEHDKSKIFQPFFTTKPSGQGTGLGLSLAYDIITKMHNGTLDLESTSFNPETQNQSGTVFTVTLFL